MASRPRNFSPWAYGMLRLAGGERIDPCPVRGGRPELDAGRRRFRSRLLEALGPSPEAVPLNAEAFDDENAGSYRRTRVVFDAEPAMSVPAYLLVPHDRVAPGPAVLAGPGPRPREDGGGGTKGSHQKDQPPPPAQAGVVVAPAAP